MRSSRMALAVALLGVGLTGCDGTTGGPDGSGSPGPAEIVDAWTSCAEAAPRAGEIMALPDLPTPAGPEPKVGRVDPAFTPVAVVRCGREIRPGAGQGQRQTATEWRAEETAALLAVLRLPDQRADGENLCTLDMVIPPWLALVDGQGRWLRPYLPTDSCGKPRTEVTAALAGLPWKAVDSRTVGQVESPAAEAAGCAQRWTDLVWVQTRDGRPGPPVPAPSPAAGPLRLCVYQVPPAERGAGKPAGDFRYGGPLPAERRAGVLRALANRRAVADCDTPASRFAVLRPPDGVTGPDRYVELDGCRRFLVTGSTGGGQLGQGDEALAALLGPI